MPENKSLESRVGDLEDCHTDIKDKVGNLETAMRERREAVNRQMGAIENTINEVKTDVTRSLVEAKNDLGKTVAEAKHATEKLSDRFFSLMLVLITGFAGTIITLVINLIVMSRK